MWEGERVRVKGVSVGKAGGGVGNRGWEAGGVYRGLGSRSLLRGCPHCPTMHQGSGVLPY